MYALIPVGDFFWFPTQVLLSTSYHASGIGKWGKGVSSKFSKGKGRKEGDIDRHPLFFFPFQHCAAID